MNRKTSDDPRQILAILNSLGVVGVTASELKSFMKGRYTFFINFLFINQVFILLNFMLF